MTRIDELRQMAEANAQDIYMTYETKGVMDRMRKNWAGFSMEKQGVLTGILLSGIILIIAGLLN